MYICAITVDSNKSKSKCLPWFPIEDTTDPCESNPCQNRGECSKSSNSYYCDCFSGYYGTNCQNRIASGTFTREYLVVKCLERNNVMYIDLNLFSCLKCSLNSSPVTLYKMSQRLHDKTYLLVIRSFNWQNLNETRSTNNHYF